MSSPLRVALLCSFNVDPVARPLRRALAEHGLDAAVSLTGYGQWEFEARDPESVLYHDARPEIAVVFAEARDLMPPLELEDRIVTAAEAMTLAEGAFSRIAAVIRQLLRYGRPELVVLVHTLVPPPRTTLGLLEGNDGYSYVAAVDAVNARLRELAASESRVRLLDYAGLVGDHGYRAWHDERLWFVGRMRLARPSLELLASRYADYVAAMRTPRRKCLVLDLDDTLWGGVLGEDGMEGIAIGHQGLGLAYRAFQQAALGLYQRGVILAVASKNNPDDAIGALRDHPDMVLRPEHFACLEVGWEPKAKALHRIAERLNIGVDGLVFWDDNPRERAEVATEVPEALVIEVPDDPADYASHLLSLTCFDTLALTAEDRRRGAMYREQVERGTFLDAAQDEEPEDYYASLRMELTVHEDDPFSVPRVAQLTQRTNQLNFTTRRYTEADIARMVDDPSWHVLAVNLTDRFGELGVIGAALARSLPEALELDTFVMSCRALGRGAETALAALVIERMQAGQKQVAGVYAPTQKNPPARRFLERMGVELRPLDDGAFSFIWTRETVTRPPWVAVHEAREPSPTVAVRPTLDSDSQGASRRP